MPTVVQRWLGPVEPDRTKARDVLPERLDYPQNKPREEPDSSAQADLYASRAAHLRDLASRARTEDARVALLETAELLEEEAYRLKRK